MEDAPQFVLYEHAVGYSLFKIKEFEDIGLIVPQVQQSLNDPQLFQSIVQLLAFEPFKDTESALINANEIAEGIVNDDLLNFLEANLPKKKKKFLLGVGYDKLAVSINEKSKIRCIFTGLVLEILRGIRTHFAILIKGLSCHSLTKAQLALGHSYSRAKIKFDIHRVDNMVIQSVAILDQISKDINLFGMRIREWYSYHFPELFTIVPDLYNYVRCTSIILNRLEINDEVVEKLQEVFPDDNEKINEIIESARTSMGMEISAMDLENIKLFSNRVASLSEYRKELNEYLKNRMNACAPSLNALIGEHVGARLISKAGSLTNLAKNPASTIQILGAEKALFRAIKTRSKTPKYGLIFNSTFIGRATGKNKGRISRFVANKCSIASRIDCFSDVPVSTFGEYLKEQVEERLKYFETGAKQRKNNEVMEEATEKAKKASAKVLKKKRKAEKKALLQKLEAENGDVEMADETAETVEA